MRFSIIKAVGWIAYIAFVLAAMTNASLTWWLLSYFAIVTALLTAVLGVIFRRGARRAYWIGFSVFGWGYVILNVICYKTYPFLDFPHMFVRQAVEDWLQRTNSGRLPTTAGVGSREQYVVAVLLMVTVSVIAIVGGNLARWFFNTQVDSETPSPGSVTA